MKVLAVDTSTKSCSVAVVDEKTLLSEYTVNHRDTHSRFVMEMIREVLNICRLTVKDIDGFAVSEGPGSFTGLRIGLSTVKGLAIATRKPVAGVSSLEALAYPISSAVSDGLLICPMLDARRKEVYTGRYRFRNKKMACEFLPCALNPEQGVQGIEEPCVLVGDGAVTYQEVIRNKLGPLAVFADFPNHTIRASVIGRMAIGRFMTGDTQSPDSLTPLYLRKPDAQKNLKFNRDLPL